MKWKLPQYSGKDYLVLAITVIPFSLLINSSVFGREYFSGLSLFLLTTFITGLLLSGYFTFCGAIAVFFKKRFPDERQNPLKFFLMISSFLVSTGLFLLLLFRGYTSIDYFNVSFSEEGFTWAYVGLGIINIFLTFLFEGVARFEQWKQNLKETEQLKLAYKQSQLQALKSQVNPHFLFNSLNSLSSLISEDEERAEKFLDELSKVYRYMLRNDDDQLVSLGTELQFTQSYFYLLKARYGEGIHLTVNVEERDKEKCLPPLSLQVLIENAFTQNAISKASPLSISVLSGSDNCIIIKNNIQPKIVTDAVDFDRDLDNLVRKYELLNQPPVVIEERENHRSIYLSLITKKAEVLI